MSRLTLLLPVLVFLGFSQPAKRPVTIFLAGDSTMADKPNFDHPERGWGMLLPEFFTSDVTIDNRARNGRSTRSFLEEGLWQGIMDEIHRGDYVVIQFGHNDSKGNSDRYASPEQYKVNLIRFVKETIAHAAHPVLCTPIMRRRFDQNGKFYDTHGLYPDMVRQVADSLEVPMVDMHRKSEMLIIGHGEEGSKKIFLHKKPGEYAVLPEGLTDDTHFSEYGARLMAGLFVEGIRELHLPLRKYLNEK